MSDWAWMPEDQLYAQGQTDHMQTHIIDRCLGNRTRIMAIREEIGNEQKKTECRLL